MISVNKPLFTLTLSLFLVISLTACKMPFSESRPTLTFSNLPDKQFSIEIVDTPENRSKGLMEREQLAADHGMLFLFPDYQKRNFWMKNTLIPLDIIYAKDNQITQILEFVPPCEAEPCDLYPSTEEVNQALEFNAGTAKELGIKVGDSFSWE